MSTNPDEASGRESVKRIYGFISYIGVPEIRSAPLTVSTVPLSLSYVMLSSFTQESPRLLGLNGARLANTPTLLLPPRRGGLTVSECFSLMFSLKPQISQMCEKPSRATNASGDEYSFSKYILDFMSAMPLWRGTANFPE